MTILPQDSDDEMNQLSLFELQEQTDDPRPLPQIVADRWNFRLTTIDQNENPDDCLYCAREWYIGLGGDKGRWSKSKADWLTFVQPVEIEVKRPRRQPEMLEFVTAEGLYSITQRMYETRGNQKISPVRDEILKYLARAGVELDKYRRDPEAAAAAFAQRADHREYRKLLKEGYSPADAEQWVNARREQKESQKRIGRVWHIRGVSAKADYTRLNNDLSRVALGKSATQLKRELAIHTTPRDVLSAAENAMIETTATYSRILHGQRDSQGVNELSEDIQDVKPILDAARPEIEKVFSKQRRRLQS